MITLHAWDRTARRTRPMSLADLDIPDLAKDQNLVIWVDLDNPTPDEETRVFQTFLPVHSLTVEDVTRLRREPESPPHLPKVEEFPDYLFVIVNPLRRSYLDLIDSGKVGLGEAGESQEHIDHDKPFTQLSAILTHNVLVTHHYEHSLCIQELRGFLSRHEGQCDRGPDFLFHLVLDSTVDHYAPVLDHIDESLDNLEVRVIESTDPHLFRRILRSKREIIVLRKTLVYEREVLVRLARGEFSLVDERETVYYRNVYDHLVRFTELIESSREMASDLLQSHLAATSNRLSKIMKVLAMISTIILPMSLISGIYGMNFHNMPELDWRFGYPMALGAMAAAGFISVCFFWWKKWL